MNPFLRQVAAAYLANERKDMVDYCFVFPNKRSGIFFRHHLTRLASGTPLILPHITTIGELTSSLSPLVEASRLDRLFLLYEEYSKLSNDIADFDRFLFWGEMILSDFDDIDLNLADASRLFVNLKRYREVSAFYLTPEQEEVLSRYWGDRFSRHSPEEFWAHLREDDDSVIEQKFLKLWEVLGPLYDNFRATLKRDGMGSRGMIVRDAVRNLAATPAESLRFRRYVFVGFNVLSLAEIKLFDILNERGVADFYWDMASAAIVSEGNKASRFMKRNAECFRSRYVLEGDGDVSGRFPSITVTGVSSGVGQTKDAGRLLGDWVKAGVIPDPSNAIETAIVLPDESLFIPMTHAVPPEITALNVTMGFPVRATSFASFVSAVVSLQLRAQFSRDSWYFFHDDVNTLASHPLLRGVDGEACDTLMRAIRDKRMFLVDASWICGSLPVLKPFFTVITDSDSTDEVYHYFRTLLLSLLENSFNVTHEEVVDEEEGGEGHPAPDSVEVYLVRSYLDALEELKGAIDRRKVKMKEMTFIQLLQKAIASMSVNFTGEPLKGLQMMGVLETRALDFDNLIILSMNERVFPRRLYSRSFIPDNLRRSYGLPTSDFQESIFSYSFYRLISRASRVQLYYDARNVSGRNSEMSRYIAQLLYLYPESAVKHELVSYTLSTVPEDGISIPKTPEIIGALREFMPGGSRALSASSINDYINCPLSFYLKHLCKLDLDEDVIDYMDSATYGSILHAAVERIYRDFLGGADEVRITSAMIDRVLGSAAYLDSVITREVNKRFNRLGDECLTPLTGEAKVLGVIMKHFIRLMFGEEKKITPFDFIAAEYKVERTMEISPSLSINIKQVIDRIDRVCDGGGERLRIVDYKTGADEISFSDFEQLFSNKELKRRKAIVQLMFYCNAYAADSGYTGPIAPVIYQLKTLSTNGLRPVSYNRTPLDDYRDINEEFLTRFRGVISEMFNSEVPFVQAPDSHNCTFCSLTAICRRTR